MTLPLLMDLPVKMLASFDKTSVPAASMLICIPAARLALLSVYLLSAIGSLPQTPVMPNGCVPFLEILLKSNS